MSTVNDPRIQVSFKSLVDLQHVAKRISLGSQFKPAGILAGRNRSKMRGQGLNFEELRPYREGDSLKNIDWKASQRSDKRMVRIYTEETDRPAIIITDQRPAMVFGSEVYTKSVIAAQATAITNWMLLQRGDRVGGIILKRDGLQSFPIKRSQQNALRFLEALTHTATDVVNARADHLNSQTKASLISDAIITAEQQLKTQGTIVFITDGDGFDDNNIERLKTLAIRHNILFFQVKDRLEEDMNASQGLVVSDGNLQLQLNLSESQLQAIKESNTQFTGRLQRSLSNTNLPFGLLNTVEPAHLQLIKLIQG